MPTHEMIVLLGLSSIEQLREYLYDRILEARATYSIGGQLYTWEQLKAEWRQLSGLKQEPAAAAGRVHA